MLPESASEISIETNRNLRLITEKTAWQRVNMLAENKFGSIGQSPAEFILKQTLTANYGRDINPDIKHEIMARLRPDLVTKNTSIAVDNGDGPEDVWSYETPPNIELVKSGLSKRTRLISSLSNVPAVFLAIDRYMMTEDSSTSLKDHYQHIKNKRNQAPG